MPKPTPKPSRNPSSRSKSPEGVVLPNTEQPFDPKLPEIASMTKLKAIAQGMCLYQGLSKEKTFPPQARYDLDDQKALLSWRVMLLPFVGQGPLFKQFHLNEPWDGPNNKKLLAQIPDFDPQTPGVTREGYTAYVVPRGQSTIFAPHESLSDSRIGDGLDRTILVLETAADKAVPWTQPEDFNLIPAKPSAGLTAEGKTDFLAAMANTMVRKIPLSVDDEFLLGLFTANGHESLNMAVLDEKKEGKVHTGPLGEAEQARQRQRPRRAGPVVRGRHRPRQSAGAQHVALVAGAETLDAHGPRGAGLAASRRRGGPGRRASRADLERIVGQAHPREAAFPHGQGRFRPLAAGDAGRRPDGPGSAAGRSQQPQRRQAGPGGIVLLGSGDLVQLHKTAVKEGLDILVHVNITTRAVHARKVGEEFLSSLAVKVQDVAKNEILWTSKTINNSAPPPGTIHRSVRNALKAEDSPEQQVKNLVSDFDAVFNEKVALTDMPEPRRRRAASTAGNAKPRDGAHSVAGPAGAALRRVQEAHQPRRPGEGLLAIGGRRERPPPGRR